ncbi:D-threonate kinase [Bacillaceae bacterium]
MREITGKKLVIADDLTGANDTGLQFFKRGFPALVSMDPDATGEPAGEEGVWVVNTETRSLSPDGAYRKIAELAKRWQFDAFPFVYKKIDSTMRGNVGAELEALMDHAAFDGAIIVPAYPENGRVTVGGYHLIRQVLLEDSEIARDPKFPVSESFLPCLLQEQTKRKVGHIPIRDIRGDRLARKVDELLAAGVEFIVCDSVADRDLKAIANLVSKRGKRFLWVGSAGLAGRLADALQKSDGVEIVRRGSDSGGSGGEGTGRPTLVVAGSVSAVTRNQVEYLSRHHFSVMPIDPLLLLQEGFIEGRDFRSFVEKASEILASGENLVITTIQSDEKRDEIEAFLAKHSLSQCEAGNRIAANIGFIASTLITRDRVNGAVLTGGDIAYQTCRQLGIRALRIVGEVEEGIPLCRTVGPLEGLPVVTKAGAFGNERSLFAAVEKIRRLDKI